MILPDKHITLQNSLLGLGSRVLSYLERPKSVSELWSEMRTITEIGNFERFILVLDLLYSLGAVELENGRLRRMRRAD